MPVRPIAAASVLLLLAGCTITPPTRPSVVTTLYFGLSKADGTHVSDAEWSAFVDAEIASAFPDGFTVLAGEGAWRENGKTMREPSRVVVIVRLKTKEVDAAIEHVRRTYCRQFAQQSVLRVDQATTRVSFE